MKQYPIWKIPVGDDNSRYKGYMLIACDSPKKTFAMCDHDIIHSCLYESHILTEEEKHFLSLSWNRAIKTDNVKEIDNNKIYEIINDCVIHVIT